MRRRVHTLDCTHLVGLHLDGHLLHRSRVRQSDLRYRDYCSWNRSVHVVGRRNGSGLNVVVVYLRDGRIIDHRSVGDVNARDISLAGAVGGEVNVTRAQRKPAYRGSSPESERSTECTTATKTNPSDQRGRVDWRHGDWAGHPAPES